MSATNSLIRQAEALLKIFNEMSEDDNGIVRMVGTPSKSIMKIVADALENQKEMENKIEALEAEMRGVKRALDAAKREITELKTPKKIALPKQDHKP